MARHARKSKRNSGAAIAVVVAFALAVLVCLITAIAIMRPPFAQPALETFGIPAIANTKAADEAEQIAVNDASPNGSEAAAIQAKERRLNRTPLIARSAGVDIRSSIAAVDVTGVLFHQASYEYALLLETELPEADYETVADSRTIRVNNAQTEGEWLDADALHLWRTSDDTEMDTSIDLGALPGTTILSPVDGTVVLVRDYLLYDEVPDVEIHIQPSNRPDLDCVLIHTTDPAVEAGDFVEAGITPIAKVRNIEESLTDVQLGFFLPEDVGGNHVHIQMNDAEFPEYREKKLEGAVSVRANLRR